MPTQTDNPIISTIQEILDEVACNPDDIDTAKVANEIYHLLKPDLEIAENMKDYWMHLADGAES